MAKFIPEKYDFRGCPAIHEWMNSMTPDQLNKFKEIHYVKTTSQE